MESFLPLPTGRRKSRRSAPAGLTAQFRLQQLEDRTVMSNSIQLSGLGWKPIGPGLILDTTASVPGLTAAGRVNAIAHAPVPFDRANPGYTGPTDPSDPTFSDWNTYFVATPGGGVARTRDGGLNWQFVTDNLPVSSWANSEQNRNLHVGAIAVSPFDRNLVLAGTGGSNGGIFDYAGTGLLISRDGGDTWSLNKGPGNAFNGTAFTKFVFHPKDANVIYAIVDGNDARDGTNFTSAVYRSIDRGQTWQNITVNTGASPFAQITDFILDPVNPNTGFVGIESYGVVRSENLELGTFPTAVYTQPNAINYELRLGGTGTQLAGGSFGQIRLAFGLGTPTQGSRIYALTTGQVVQTATQLFRSDNSGTDFRRLDPFPGLGTSTATPVNQDLGTYALTLIADPTAPNRIFIGGEGAGSIQVLTNADYNPDNTTPNYVNLTLPPAPGDAYINVRDIVFDNTGAKDIDGRAVTPGRLLLATDSGVYRYQAPAGAVTTTTNFLNNNLAFVSLNGVVGTTSLSVQQVFSTGLPPRDDNHAVIGTYINGSSVFQDTGPLATTDPNYSKLFAEGPIASAAAGSVVRGNGGETIFNSIDPNRAFRVTNHSNFTDFNTRDYETAKGGLFQRSTDGGLTWTTSTTGIQNPNTTTFVVPLSIDPSPQVGTPNARLLLGTDAVNVSTDDGQTWNPIPPLPFVTGARQQNNPRAPHITALANGRSSRFTTYAAVDWRTNGTVADGPALYRIDGPFAGNPQYVFTNVTPGTTSYLLPPTAGAPGFPVPNDFSIDSDIFSGEITDIVVDPANSNIVYIVRDSLGYGPDTTPQSGGAHRIYRTTDGGFTWTDISGNLPASTATADGLRVYSIALDPNRFDINPLDPNSTQNQADDDLYIGTSTGVWKLTNPVASTTWTRVAGTGGGAAATGTDQVAGQLPDVMVRDVKLNTTTGVLAASTFGRGVWELQIRAYVRGQVFNDVTGNGAFDAAGPGVLADAPLPGAVVVANRIVTNPGQEANTTTTSTGEWVFPSIRANTYQFIPLDASTTLVDTATKYYFTSDPIVKPVTPTTTLNGQNLFLFRRVSIAGFVYEDGNGNGTFDAGENPAVGYVVQLLAPAGTLSKNNPTVVATVTTDANGNYTFLGVGPLRDVAVGPGTPFGSGYQVAISKANYQQTQTPGPTGVLLSGVNLTDAANQPVTRVGAFKLGQLSGKVFEDANGDGALNNGEVGLGGFTLSAVDASNGSVVATTVSAADGSYFFGDLVTTLRAGSYTIVVDQSNHPDFARTTPIQAPFPVQSGTNTTGLNVGEFRQATIAGNAFEDVNGNGVRDNGESNPQAGVTISLIDPRTRAVVQSTTTDPAGNYSFGGLFPLDLNGNKTPYLVELTAPINLIAQTINDPAVTLRSGSFSAVDLPLFVRTTVTGFAFEDVNGNGQRDNGEPGLAGGSVSLLNSTSNAVVQSTNTDGGGRYTFTGVGPIPGPVPYRVGANPAGFVQTTPNPPDFTLTSGVPVTVGVDIGLFRLASFSGTVFDDANGDGGFTNGEFGVAGRVVQLINVTTGAVVASTVTDGNGNYFLNAGAGNFRVALAPVGGFVQTTTDRAPVQTTSGLATTGVNFGSFQLTVVTGNVFNDLNGNGTRETEPGLGNVTVELVNSVGTVVASAQTDGTGFFTIRNVGPGSYTVRAVPPAGFVASTPASQTFTATSGTPTTFTFGDYLPTTVSGTVYEDLNRSNSNNAGDIPSPGWTAQLTRPGGILAGTLVSNAQGNFSFANLAPGTYTVRVLNRQGFQVLNNGTQTVTVVSGTPVTLAPIGVLKLGSLSGAIYLDSNRNGRLDTFERGLPGGVVVLRDGNNVVAGTATTDANGAYTFLGLQTGSYRVVLQTPPAGFALSAAATTAISTSTAVGSTSSNNVVAGLNFGLVGRRRYALAADGGGGPRVQVFDALTNAQLQDFFVYETEFTGGVRVAEADVNGDGVDDLIVAPGKGGGPRIRVLSGTDGSELYNYFAYEPSFTAGLYVTAGDVDGDGFADIITGTDAGGGARVTVFSGKTGVIKADYFAYDPSFRGGVRVGSADTDGNGVSEILTAQGVGGEPLVKVFGGGNFRELASFEAFDPSYTGGLFIAAAAPDLATGRGDIVVGSGVAYPTTPVLRSFDGQTFALKAEVEAFPSGGSAGGYQSEVRVASFDRNGDNTPDFALASGAGTASRLRFVDGRNFQQIGEEVQPYEAAFLGGIFIG